MKSSFYRFKTPKDPIHFEFDPKNSRNLVQYKQHVSFYEEKKSMRISVRKMTFTDDIK